MGGSKGDVSQVEDTEDVGSSIHVTAIDARALSEDASIATKTELFAWYMVGMAIDSFQSLQKGVLFPVILESMASAAGYNADGTPCDTSVKGYSCKAYFGGILIDTTSFTLYISTIAVGVQLLFFISFAAIADYGRSRKFLLFAFSYLMAACTICYLAVTKPIYYNALAVLQIFALTFNATATIFWYSYMPILTRYHPMVVAARDSEMPEEEYASVVEKISNGISAYGFVIGYLCSIITLILGLVYLMIAGSSLYNMQIAVAAGGIWTFVFSIIPVLLLKRRPGPAIPKGTNPIVFSWKKTWQTLRKARFLGETYKFLFAWFWLGDGVNTVSSVSILYAKKQLGASSTSLFIVAALLPAGAVVGCYVFLFIQRFFKLSTKFMLMIASIGFGSMPIWGLVGIGSILQLYIAGVLVGVFQGPIRSFARSQFAELLPTGHESEFFGLFELADVGSAWLGPLVVGFIALGGTSSISQGFWWVLACLIVSCIILWRVEVKKGVKQADHYAEQQA